MTFVCYGNILTIDNARKACTSGQRIILRAYESTIEVVDTGEGISQDEIEYIAEPFYMVDRSRSKKRGGAGLGLALVGQIVKAHCARMTIESTLGQGTTIRLIFEETQ